MLCTEQLPCRPDRDANSRSRLKSPTSLSFRPADVDHCPHLPSHLVLFLVELCVRIPGVVLELIACDTVRLVRVSFHITTIAIAECRHGIKDKAI